VIIASLALCLALVVGCGAKSPSRAVLSTTFRDREVKASLDGDGTISSEGYVAVVHFVGGKLIVDKEAVRLDGEELAKLPEETKKVEVDYTAGKLTVTADGRSVVSKEIRK
jgi:hypothetical protein